MTNGENGGVLLEAEGVNKQFTATNFRLEQIALHLGRGLHVLIGPNGAGKTTLLRMLSGLAQPESGTIVWNGQDIYEHVVRYKRRLGYLPQNFGFYEHMTGRDFLVYIAKLKGIQTRFIADRVEYVADLLGLTRFVSEKIALWPIGFKQRLGLAQALLNDPSVLILDEPFNRLDADAENEVGKILAELAKRKVVLFSTHRLSGLRVAKLLLMIEGRICFDGLPSVFIDAAQGCVWTASLKKDEWREWQKQFPDGTAVFHGDDCRCTVISDQKPDIAGVHLTNPTLEQAYLFWLRRFRQNRERIDRHGYSY